MNFWKNFWFLTAIATILSLGIVSHTFGFSRSCQISEAERMDELQKITTPVQACTIFCLLKNYPGDNTIVHNGCFCKTPENKQKYETDTD